MTTPAYGFSPETLPTLIATPTAQSLPSGHRIVAAATAAYGLERIELEPQGTFPLALKPERAITLYIETGTIRVGEEILASGEVTTVNSATPLATTALTAAVFYLFEGPAKMASAQPDAVKTKTFDARTKYWGTIETMVNAAYAGKKLIFHAGQHSSLHYHCDKTETYFIQAGRLLVRLRAGRGEDQFFELTAGQTLHIPRGLMHQDAGLDETVIIEVSSHDEDSDSFIVEDGQRQNLFDIYRQWQAQKQ